MHIRNSSVVRAREDGVSATYVVTGPRASALADVSLHEIDGCFLRRATTLEHADMRVFDMSFDRVLRGGQAHGFSYVLSFDQPRPDVQPQNLFGYATHSAGALCTIKTVFDKDARPVKLAQVYRKQIGEPVDVVAPIDLDRRGQAQLVVTDARPGWHGLSWTGPRASDTSGLPCRAGSWLSDVLSLCR